jgi:hypothetical protein
VKFLVVELLQIIIYGVLLGFGLLLNPALAAILSIRELVIAACE